MAQEQSGPVRAPEFPANATWVQGGPLRLVDLRGRSVLIDFWDYTCVNCIRTLPYVKEWHRRYSSLGLVVIGVHAPEFSFAHNGDHVRRALGEHGLDYPIVLDNDYAIWQAYANRYWPAKYLIDREGNLRYYHFGEGGYRETETAIQTVLREAFQQIVLPDLMAPVRESDAPGAVCYRVTPELYLGHQRGRIGNTAEVTPDKPATYRDRGKHAEGFFFLEGDWLLSGEHTARPVGANGESKLHLRYMAKEVNLVMSPPLAGGKAQVELLQDGRPLAPEDAGEDVRVADGRATLSVTSPRMYRLVNNREIDTHELTLTTSNDGLALYAFTFVSCVEPAPEAPILTPPPAEPTSPPTGPTPPPTAPTPPPTAPSPPPTAPTA
ncbi:MAG: redoxin family protein [Chloroflexi bacterium]|nr:redoxin family protein [Chloroflexota bacterium]